MAIGLGVDHHLRAHCAIATAFVIDRHSLAQGFAERIRDRTRGNIGCAAGRRGHDDGELALGEGLRSCPRRCE
jgi:hypothetical protein